MRASLSSSTTSTWWRSSGSLCSTGSSGPPRPRATGGTAPTKKTLRGGVFWLHVASFTVYNALIGYLLLHREQQGLCSLILFAFAMGVHFVVNDYGLRVDHKGNYERIGRWVLVAGILAGWVVGLIFEVSEAALGVLFAFLAGGVIMNVLKEELPEERKSRFWAFALGAALYAAILLTL